MSATFTSQVEVAVFFGSLTEVAFSSTMADGALPGVRVTWTRTLTVSPNAAVVRLFGGCADQPSPATAVDGR